MNKKAQISMPSGMGGIVRYFDNYKSKLHIDPDKVIFLTGLLMVVVILLHLVGPGIFGF